MQDAGRGVSALCEQQTGGSCARSSAAVGGFAKAPGAIVGGSFCHQPRLRHFSAGPTYAAASPPSVLIPAKASSNGSRKPHTQNPLL